MAPVVKKIYDQMPEPKWVIAMGTCLCSGGLFDSFSVVQGLDKILPVDVFIPGCPPRPESLILALTRLQEKISDSSVKTYKSRCDYKPKVRLPARSTDLVKTKENTFIVNMGPSHPATHGVLRLVLELDGETIINCDTKVGYLFRAYEKLAENRTFQQFITYTDRLDYLSPASNNVAYALAVEKLLNIEITRRTKYIRVIACELARISSHLLSIGVYGIDLGAMTIFFYTFEQREKIYELFELLTGIRFTTSFTRIGGVTRDVDSNFINKLNDFINSFPNVLEEVRSLLDNNQIWLDRNKNIGILTKEMAINYGITGPNLRASGIPLDLRKTNPYLVYDEFNFDVITEKEGDCYARYMVRIKEIYESLKIIKQAIDGLPTGPIYVDNPYVVMPQKDKVYTKMEELIYHFKIASGAGKFEKGEIYSSIENPKGELGFYIISDGCARPFRLKIKSPSFANLQILSELVKGHMIADIVSIISSLDPVMGECDK
jgi:NADH-quinone oxidoreductase subunit D